MAVTEAYCSETWIWKTLMLYQTPMPEKCLKSLALLYSILWSNDLIHFCISNPSTVTSIRVAQLIFLEIMSKFIAEIFSKEWIKNSTALWFRLSLNYLTRNSESMIILKFAETSVRDRIWKLLIFPATFQTIVSDLDKWKSLVRKCQQVFLTHLNKTNEWNSKKKIFL